ncbi:hypothetical protein ACE38W_02490 [Chitinophaga sp. Hz27]|uniref:hypothetical protein n=1 Tax=Chitinophaga sp. Hz27 TaxID=3347169 RepID=UPI0035DE5393
MSNIFPTFLFAFLLILIPIIGSYLQYYFSKKIFACIFIASIALLLPGLRGYHYAFNGIEFCLWYMVFLSGYTYCCKLKKPVRWFTGLICILLFIICVPGAYFIYFFGEGKIKSTWEGQGYQVVTLDRDLFFGSKDICYELEKYTQVPIFLKQVDEIKNADDNHCWVHFKQERFDFNACNPELSTKVK